MQYQINKTNYRDFHNFAENRLPHRSYFIPFFNRECLNGTTYLTERFKSDAVLMLSGEWDFRYYKSASQLKSVLDTDTLAFHKVHVPSTWQKTGYDQINYLNSMYPFRCNPPKTPKNCPVGLYRKQFTLQKEEDCTYFITFLGVGASLDLYINGEFIGYGEGSHNSREFDITAVLKDGKNELVAVVYKWSTGTYLECQDMFRENGIFRDVYITKQPKTYIYDFEFKTEKCENGYNALLSADIKNKGDYTLQAEIYLDGKLKAKSTSLDGKTMSFQNLDVEEWNAEKPVCYDLILSISDGSDEIQCIRQKVGFCTIRLDGCRYLWNEKPIKLKGVNHHDTHPVRGYAMTVADLQKDIELMKAYNVNCMRTSHYPPDPILLTMSDIYGIYVVDEADIETHGCFIKNNLDLISDDPKWEAHYLDRVAALFERDKNHPCVVMWSLGNEAGGIKNFDACYEYLKSKSQIPVHYEPACRSKRIRYDILAYFYTPTEEMRALARGEWKDERFYDAPFFLCEYAHSMGVGPGGLDDYWDVIYNDDRFLGGCIWEWADHAHYDEKAKYKYTYGGDHKDRRHSGNFCCDGLFYPDRTPSPSALCMKNVYSPLHAYKKDGKFYVTNRNCFTATNGVHITCKLLKNGTEEVLFETDEAILPQSVLEIPIQPQCRDTDDAFFVFTYTKANGEEIAKEQITLHEYLPKKDFQNQKLSWCEKDGKQQLAGTPAPFGFDKDGKLVALCDLNGKSVLANNADGFMPMLYQATIDNHTYIVGALKKAGLDKLKVQKAKSAFDEYLNTVTEKLTLSAKGKKRFTAEIVQKAISETELCVTVSFKSLVKKPLDMLQMGVTLPLDGAYKKVRYYGLGETESYADFTAPDTMGIYETTVQEMYVENIKPQESGNRCMVRFAEVTDKNGHGVRITALNAPLNFKAVDVDEANLRKARHIEDVVRTDKTFVHINGFMRGIGSQSCGPDTAEQYKKIMHLGETYTYAFKLERI